MNPGWLSKVLGKLSLLEQSLAEYERGSGEDVIDSIKQAVVLAGLPTELRSMMQMKAKPETDAEFRRSGRDLATARM
eukprot:3044900-Alexandrium_andersonii.AAC.1